MAIRETQSFGLPREMHNRRIDEKLLRFNGLSINDVAATQLAVIAINARQAGGAWLVVVTDPASRSDASGAFGSFVENDGSLSQKGILACAENWIRSAAATRRVPGRVLPASNPFDPTQALGYLLVEAREAPQRSDESDSQGPVEVSCDTCVAACCRRGMSVFLTDKEAAQQRRAMRLQRIKAAASYEREIPVQLQTIDIAGNPIWVETQANVPKHHGVYVLKEDCGNLGEAPAGGENRPCTIHHKEGLYPRACQNFAVGSPKCLARRAEYGLDGHEPTLDLHDRSPIEVRARRSKS